MTPRNTVCLLALLMALSFSTASSFSACDDEKLVCTGEGTECVKGKCKCMAGYVGNPHLGCHTANHKICSIVSDPNGHTFGYEPHKGIELTMPCSFLVSHYISKANDATGQHKTHCEVKVHAAEKRHKGKLYIHGIAADITFSHKYSGAGGRVVIRAMGSAKNGQYNYVLERKKWNGDWTSNPNLVSLQDLRKDLLGSDNVFMVQDNTNRVHIKMPKCALEIHFRPADISKKWDTATELPGVIVAVDHDIHNIQYEAAEKSFCLTPHTEKINVADVSEVLHLNNEESFLYRALISDAPSLIDFPDVAAHYCHKSSKTLKDCHMKDKATGEDNLKVAMDMCGFILNEPLFMNCFSEDEDSSDLMDLFEMCIDSQCNKKAGACSAVKSRINGRKCWFRVQGSFLTQDCNLM